MPDRRSFGSGKLQDRKWGVGGRWGEGQTNNSNKTKEAVGRGKRDQRNNNNIRGMNVSEIKA